MNIAKITRNFRKHKKRFDDIMNSIVETGHHPILDNDTEWERVLYNYFSLFDLDIDITYEVLRRVNVG